MTPPSLCPVVWIDGRFCTREEAVIPITDRSFLYGDGVFETLRVYGGRPFEWPTHWQRMQRGANQLRLTVPTASPQLEAALQELLQKNGEQEGIIRLQLSRGNGPRGYGLAGTGPSRLLATLHPAPEVSADRPRSLEVILATERVLAGDRWSYCKSCNRLPQILAKAEAEAHGADEALLLNSDGDVVEASGANVFWVESDEVLTPPLSSGALAGVTRSVVFEICRELAVPVREQTLPASQVASLETVFLTSSVAEIARVQRLDGRAQTASDLVDRIHRAFAGRVRPEGTGVPPKNE